MAGMAFDSAFPLELIQYYIPVGAKFHIRHGRANAIIMPYVIEVNTEANKMI